MFVHTTPRTFLILAFCLFLGTLFPGFEHSSFADGTYQGVGSCASSNCHGQPHANTTLEGRILHDEFSIWYTYDRHSKAFSALLTAEGKKIASNLSINEPDKDARCINCHATNAPKD